MDTQRCIGCHKTKPLIEYYRHGGMASGRLGKCKECSKRYAKERRAKMRAPRKRSPEHEAWLAANREKSRVYAALHCALRSGAIKIGPCERCGVLRDVQGHHDDYSKPLSVRWLCRKHHAEHHKKHRQMQSLLQRAVKSKQ